MLPPMPRSLLLPRQCRRKRPGGGGTTKIKGVLLFFSFQGGGGDYYNHNCFQNYGCSGGTKVLK